MESTILSMFLAGELGKKHEERQKTPAVMEEEELEGRLIESLGGDRELLDMYKFLITDNYQQYQHEELTRLLHLGIKIGVELSESLKEREL